MISLLESAGIAVITLSIAIIYLVYQTTTRPSNFPPGPMSLPIIGNAYHFLTSQDKIKKLAQVHGNVFSMKSGRRNLIMLYGYEMIKEVLIDRGREFANRHNSRTRKLMRGECVEGVMNAKYGKSWTAHRKLYHAALRNKCTTKQGIQQLLSDELPYLADAFEAACKSGEGFNPFGIFQCATINISNAFMFGKRYSYDDQKFKKLLEYNEQCFQNFHTASSNNLLYLLLVEIPFILKYWAPQPVKDLIRANRNMRDFVKAEIENHKKNLDPEAPQDFIDYYLLELRKLNNQLFSDSKLEQTALDIFQAGADTTATTLGWIFLYIANNLKVQKKMHEEIDRVIGFNRDPRYEDRRSMPYCEATILEAQRFSSVAPHHIPHSPSQDTTIRGYDIPAGTIVMGALYAMHHDPKYWKNPFNFDPENFLDPDGTVGVRNAFMPFGSGPRLCLGMTLVKQELFVLTLGILQKFKILLPTGVKKLPEDPFMGIVVKPKAYQLKIVQRF